jgi:mutual gliding-motility protein MglA
MAEFSPDKNKLTLKLVYYGPAMSGKTTNLMRLHDQLIPELRHDIMCLETANDRTLFFDLLPVGFRADSGLQIQLKVFTVPGQVIHNGTRKAMLSRADGIVFVADSQPSQNINNSEAFANLEENVHQVGLDFDNLPLVVQFNKRDLPNVVAEDEIRNRWVGTPWPLMFASALIGTGVLPTFRTLLQQLYPSIDAQYGLSSRHGLDSHTFVNDLTGTRDGYQSI